MNKREYSPDQSPLKTQHIGLLSDCSRYLIQQGDRYDINSCSQNTGNAKFSVSVIDITISRIQCDEFEIRMS